MEKFNFNPDAESWPENFGVQPERASELLTSSSPFLTKLISSKRYNEKNLVPDLLTLATNDNEKFYLLFFAGQKIKQFESIQKEAEVVYSFVNKMRITKTLSTALADALLLH